MQVIRRRRTFLVAVAWVALALMPVAATDFWHQDEMLDPCVQTSIAHDGHDHHISASTKHHQDAAHCDLCHLLRSLRSDEARTRVGCSVDDELARGIRVESLITLDSRSHGRLPSRSPPAS